jgi:hypothetical protein
LIRRAAQRLGLNCRLLTIASGETYKNPGFWPSQLEKQASQVVRWASQIVHKASQVF